MRTFLITACLVAGCTAAAAGQTPASPGLWAAQVGVNDIALSWDPVPGATQYRIHLGDPSAPGTFQRRPVSTLSGNARGGRLSGMQRVANGIMLVAVDASGRVLRQAEFNRITPVTAYPPPVPPAGVTAEATSTNEITLTWDAVPGATAYVIGRAVARSGFSMLCRLCPAEPRYVDREAAAGLSHTYSVAAIFPSGDVSTRVVSAAITPGATQVPTTPGSTLPGQPVTSLPTTTTPAYTPPGQPATSLPTTTTPAYTPPGQPASTLPATTTTTTSQTGTVHTATPVTSTGTTSPDTTLLGRLQQLLSGAAGNVATTTAANTTAAMNDTVLLATLRQMLGTSGTVANTSGGMLGTMPIDTSLIGQIRQLVGSTPGTLAGAYAASQVTPTSVTAALAGPGAVNVSWQPPTGAGVTGYHVKRSLNGGALEILNTVPATTLSYRDAFFPATLFTAGAIRAKYTIAGVSSSGITGPAVSNEVLVQAPVATATPPTGGAVAACRLDYQRADNMWAAFGKPTGTLGAESISLAGGQNKVFITDWKYEKQRNDGANYYGSHLRIATNATSQMVRLHLRSWTLTGLVVFARTGTDTFWIRLDPGATRQFQADLMEVFCES